MGKEIERKFLVVGDEWRKMAHGVYCRQGYLCSQQERTVRLRVIGPKAYLTIKGPTQGLTRAEYEYEIPVEDCNQMLDSLAQKPLIEKKRYTIVLSDVTWEIDEFTGENAGLLVAEVELKSEEQEFTRPIWIGKEVSGQAEYYNSNLVLCPFCKWK